MGGQGLSVERGFYMVFGGLAVVGICAVGLFIWFFWEKVSKKFKGAEKMSVMILGKGPTVQDVNLLVDNIFYLSDDATAEAWAFHPEAVQYTKDGKVGGLLLTHDSCMPQFPAKRLDMGRMYSELKRAIRPITLAQFHSAYENEIKRSDTSPLAEWLGLAVMTAVGGVLVMVIIILLTSDLMPW